MNRHIAQYTGFHNAADDVAPHDASDPTGGLTATAAIMQGLTLVHFPARRKHTLWDTLGHLVGYVGCIYSASLLVRGTGRYDQNGLG